MLFNSYEYLLFLPIVAIIYFMLPQVKIRVIWLLLASYFFYMCWNPVFIVLIIASTVIDYLAGRFIDRTKEEQKKKLFLWCSIVANIGILFYFKYYNFLAENIQIVFNYFQLDWIIMEHTWLLPVGISFYTFQSLSYTIDVYNEDIKAERNFFVFALYVSFFPQLVAGPIERSTNLIPQFLKKQQIDYEKIRSGLLLILLGLFKKIVIADRFAVYVDQIFENPGDQEGWAVILATIFFVFQIYCDFSGYSDVAIGSARILGFDLMENFKGPLFSKNITEMWRRWHISFSTWIRDYLYEPLLLNSIRRFGRGAIYMVIIFTFVLIGIWHGPNWTFVVFGILQGLALSYDIFTSSLRERLSNKLNTKFYTLISIVLTFVFWSFCCLLFRANNIGEALILMEKASLFNSSNFNVFLNATTPERIELQISLLLLAVITFIHFFEYRGDIVEYISAKTRIVRWTVYILLLFSIPILGQYGTYKPFIYFQF